MKQCKCGSYALNLHKEGIDQGDLCDRHYWQDRAEKAEKDAARYQYFRSSAAAAMYLNSTDEKLDFAIDAAIAAQKGGAA